MLELTTAEHLALTQSYVTEMGTGRTAFDPTDALELAVIKEWPVFQASKHSAIRLY